jgi:ribosomal protein S18 acetylase RimI-like enzyme
MAAHVRPIADRDESVWSALFAGYRSFYGEAEDPRIVANAWGWLLRREHALLGLVAVDEDDTPIALANLRWFARPDDGDVALFLDDLFTAPEARGKGAAGALLREAASIAAEGGATVVRWITADDNTTARRLYDRHAEPTRWVTYDMRATTRADARTEVP